MNRKVRVTVFCTGLATFHILVPSHEDTLVPHSNEPPAASPIIGWTTTAPFTGSLGT